MFYSGFERELLSGRDAISEEVWVYSVTKGREVIMGWVFGVEYGRESKVHPDLVPYAKLGRLEKDKDAVFVALCEIARNWIRDDNEGPF